MVYKVEKHTDRANTKAQERQGPVDNGKLYPLTLIPCSSSALVFVYLVRFSTT